MVLKTLLDNTAINVFLGTPPLLLTLAWGLFQNDRRLTRIENKLDPMDVKLSNVGERLVKVETKLEGTKLVIG
ncbi:MAG TPA: hypothetical protein VKA15_17175 [Isosphaeraceae bacterium]|nr:hypothetical protein [Isosphaeraceae bacterium]